VRARRPLPRAASIRAAGDAGVTRLMTIRSAWLAATRTARSPNAAMVSSEFGAPVQADPLVWMTRRRSTPDRRRAAISGRRLIRRGPSPVDVACDRATARRPRGSTTDATSTLRRPASAQRAAPTAIMTIAHRDGKWTQCQADAFGPFADHRASTKRHRSHFAIHSSP